MANILVRDLPEKTVEKLKEKAAAKNRSLQAELREILENESEKPNPEEVWNTVNEIYEKYKAEGRTFSDSTQDVREDRDSR